MTDDDQPDISAPSGVGSTDFPLITLGVVLSIVRAITVCPSVEFWQVEPGTTYTNGQHPAAGVRLP